MNAETNPRYAEFLARKNNETKINKTDLNHARKLRCDRTKYEGSLKASGVACEMHAYPGSRHGFHSYSTPRYNHDAAHLAWDRMVAFFNQHLSERTKR